MLVKQLESESNANCYRQYNKYAMETNLVIGINVQLPAKWGRASVTEDVFCLVFALRFHS